METTKKKRKVKTWVWVVGWILFFPIPLTAIIVRSNRLKKVVKGLLIFILWFYILVSFIYMVAGAPLPESEDTNSTVMVKATAEDEIDYIEIFKTEIGDSGALFSKTIPHDVTGKWRKCLIYSNQDFIPYAHDYYRAYFESDDETHAVINLFLKTTTKLSVSGVDLIAVVYEYVDGEENDAKDLFGGMLYSTYVINKDTGEYEKLTTDRDTAVVKSEESIEDAVSSILSNRAFSDYTVSKDGVNLIVEFQKLPMLHANLTDEQNAYNSTVVFADDFLEQYKNDDEWDMIIVRFVGVGEFRLTKDMILDSEGYGRFFDIREEDFVTE